jgi:hypothetical protein
MFVTINQTHSKHDKLQKLPIQASGGASSHKQALTASHLLRTTYQQLLTVPELKPQKARISTLFL